MAKKVDAKKMYEDFVKLSNDLHQARFVSEGLNPERKDDDKEGDLGLRIVDGKLQAINYLSSNGVQNLNHSASQDTLNTLVSEHMIVRKHDRDTYFNDNLEHIIEGLPEGKLEKKVSEIPIVEVKNDKRFEEVAKAEANYRSLDNSIKAYKSGQLNDAHEGEIKENILKFALGKRIAEAKKQEFSKHDIQRLAYITTIKISSALNRKGISHEGELLVKALKDEFESKLDKNYSLVDYARDKITYLADKNKEFAADTIYRISK